MEQAGAARRALREPRSERERLRTLASLRVTGTGPVAEFDAIAALARRLTHAPIAAVTFVDGRSEWVKAAAGHPLSSVDRGASFGGIVIEHAAPLVVENTLAESRFDAHPWVAGDPGARFYAGVPLTAEGGVAVGTLAVLDTEPRAGSAELLEALEEAVAVLMPHLERRREEAFAQNLTSVIGFDGYFQRVSTAFETTLGWRASEMVGRPVTDFVHPDDIDRTRARIDRIASGYRAGGFENRYRAKDGSYRWLLWNAHVVPHEKRFYSAGKDITDRKRNELALRESEARYRLLAENATDMIAGCELDGTITYVSNAGLGMTGWRTDEMVGVDSYEFIHPDDQPHVRVAHNRLLERLQPERYSYRFRCKDGSWIWVESNSRVVRDQRSRPVGIQSATRDITATKEAAASLETVREQLRRAFDDAPIGMSIITLDGVFERVNAALCELLGYGEEELLHTSALKFIHPDDRGGEDLLVQELLDGSRRSFAMEKRHMHKSGRLVWARVTTSITREVAGAGERRLLVHTEDVSERRRGAEDLLRAREEAERANRAKSDFLSRMSHELRTPLNAVLGFAQLLESDELTADQRASVARIMSGGYHLLNLVNDVLDMSAIEAGQLPISTERVAVRAVVRETVELMSPLADQRSIRTHADLPDGDVAVLANEQRLKQVLLNLVSNAVKYSRTDADVTVAVERAGDAHVRIHVVDAGHGIPPEKLERAFLPFERLGERREVEGTGLGLPLSRNLVQAMGGTLTVESGSAGSTFTVELPVAHGAAEASEHADAGTAAAAGDAPAGGARRVVYIEDNPSNIALIEALFARRGDLELHTARRGDAGLELARRVTPEVVAVDLHLPDMTGAAVVAALRDDKATRAVPVIVVTADVTQEHEQHLRDAGATAYLTKPLDLRRFEAALERALSRTPAQG